MAASTKPPHPAQFIRVADQQVALPPGVTVAEWGVERLRWQNPRIRSFLGCIRLLEGVLESNYSILHCSPERLMVIWSKVREVADLVRRQLAPLLRAPSVVPRLEEARAHVESGLEMLSSTLLRDIERFPQELDAAHVLEVRKLLCVTIGQLHAFLQDSFGRIVAGDPRSLHDADYYLSKRFPQDIDEAEWLHQTVAELQQYLHREIEVGRERYLVATISALHQEGMVPDGAAWDGTARFLAELLHGLTPKLREVLALRGIRFDEMEILDRYTLEMPVRCRGVFELHEAAREVIDWIRATATESRREREQSVRDLLHCHAVFGRRLEHMLADVDRLLRDLVAFVPLWLRGIEGRRALLLVRSAREGRQPRGDGFEPPPGAEPTGEPATADG